MIVFLLSRLFFIIFFIVKKTKGAINRAKSRLRVSNLYKKSLN
ncbi:conserved hypothetical protein (plasmid) [Borreliella burgdorferi CA-11.2A]|uniref:Uncharacterized protein n=1 Tax=Borreliella burgdorferi 118a TaxID=476210 RepID=A0A7U3YAU6_BORBG|nr:conserved hypothetical protein [Borreliella burgdorferi 72a]ACN56206.1 conserved hypothetical protein [Borreliella burgdorferi CA-11.2A]ACN92681.1 conserved hypothetical protein [Borreliella burgdorferi 118a]